MSCSIWTAPCWTAISTTSFRRGAAAALCCAARADTRGVPRSIDGHVPVGRGELAWTDLDYWTEQVGIDVVALHKELDHLVGFLPSTETFLRDLKLLGRRVTILTNAHQAGVDVKIAKTGLDRHVDRIVTASEVGYLKMRPAYWPVCQQLVGFNPERALFIDDDEGCLAAAKQFGIAHLVHSAKSSSQLPPVPSASFRSVENLSTMKRPLPQGR